MTINDIYDIGRATAGKTAAIKCAYDYLDDEAREVIFNARCRDENGNDYFDDLAYAVFAAGFYGTAMPQKVTGWRYGDIPTCGRSKNYRDNELELGVSMAEITVDGKTIATQDEISLIFVSDRPVVRCEGWLVTHKRGGDGEPLVVRAKKLKNLKKTC